MTASNPRVQVTVDRELAAALDAVDPDPATRSGLIRALALRGAEAVVEDEQRPREAHEALMRIARGEVDYDFEGLREMIAARHEPFR